MGKSFQDLLTLETGRVFIDVAYRGCGSGCKYCYVPTCSEPQELANYEDLAQIADELNQNFRSPGQIISFCPNTEPFKTQASTDRSLFILRKLEEKRFYIQFSTKEYLSGELLQQLDALSERNPIFINISIPFVGSPGLEPGAADVEQRVSNLERISGYPHLKSCLYIKPCSQNAMDHVQWYIAAIKRVKPDYVCIGVVFNQGVDTPCTTLHRPQEAAQVIPAQKKLLLDFAEKIRLQTQCPVVHSSICVIIQTEKLNCPLNLKQFSPEFCGACGSQGVSATC